MRTSLEFAPAFQDVAIPSWLQLVHCRKSWAYTSSRCRSSNRLIRRCCLKRGERKMSKASRIRSKRPKRPKNNQTSKKPKRAEFSGCLKMLVIEITRFWSLPNWKQLHVWLGLLDFEDKRIYVEMDVLIANCWALFQPSMLRYPVSTSFSFILDL